MVTTNTTNANDPRYALITWLDTILYDSDSLLDVFEIYLLWRDLGRVRGIYDYERNTYLSEEEVFALCCQSEVRS